MHFLFNATIVLQKKWGKSKYDFTLWGTQTYEIIEDVSRRKSEIGILFQLSKNEATYLVYIIKLY